MSTIRVNGSREVDVKDDESILEALLFAGILVEYSCRNGRCGSCRGRVTAGKTEILHHEFDLTEQERDKGWVLLCARRAVGDVNLDVDIIEGISPPQRRVSPCKIQSIELVAPHVMRVLLRTPPSFSLQFLHGQYIEVSNAAGLTRSYSIASSPAHSIPIELHISKVQGGEMSNYWFEKAREGDLLRLNGPLGTFFLRDVARRSIVFLATGTGIAPVKSMLAALERLEPSTRPSTVTVFWGGRTEADHYFTPIANLDGFRYVPVLSQPSNRWVGASGYVQSAAVTTIADFAETTAYACGSPAMIDDARAALLSAGLSPRAFFSDAFLPSY